MPGNQKIPRPALDLATNSSKLWAMRFEQIIAVLVSGACALVLACQGEPLSTDEPTPAPRPEYYRVEVPPDAPSRGPETALVTLVSFSDFAAPRGARNAKSIAALIERFPEQLRWVHRANPLPRHQDADRAERAARAAGRQGRFWEFHDKLWERGALGESDLEEIAGQLGCDLVKWKRDMLAPAVSRQIAADRQAALELGLDKVPQNFVNGRPLDPIRFPADTATLIDEELSRAQALREQGVPLAKIYDTIVENGRSQMIGLRIAAPQRRDPEAIYRVPVESDDPTKGGPAAPLTLVIFADFECPFAARSHLALQRLSKRLGPRIRLVFKHHPGPTHPNASLAAEAAVEAQVQGRFWEYHDLLFANWNQLSPTVLLDLGSRAGLDHQELEAALSDHRHARRVARDQSLARSLDLNGTPHFFFNGALTSGSRTFDQLEVLAAKALARAEPMLESGHKPAELYAAIIAQGASEPVMLEPGSAIAESGLVTDGSVRVYPVEVPKDAPSLGPVEAQVTIVAFVDYQCGRCRFADQAIEALRREHDKALRVVVRHHPVAGHEHAVLAAEAAVEAGRQGLFWQFHRRLLGQGNSLRSDDLLAHAAAIGMDQDRLRQALEQRTHRERVALDIAQSRALGNTSSPSLFVNGRKIGSGNVGKELEILVGSLLAQRPRPAQGRGTAQ